MGAKGFDVGMNLTLRIVDVTRPRKKCDNKTTADNTVALAA